MKAACLLTDFMYSLAVSDNGGIGAGSGALGLGPDATSESTWDSAVSMSWMATSPRALHTSTTTSPS